MAKPLNELVEAIVDSLHRQDGWDHDFQTHAASRVTLCCPVEPDLLSICIRDDAGRRVAEFGGVRFFPVFGGWRHRISSAWHSVYVPAERRRQVEAVSHAVSALNGGATS